MKPVDPLLAEFLHAAELDHGATIIQEQGKAPCELCQRVAELRPYGPNGENICFPCGMVDEEGTKARFLAM